MLDLSFNYQYPEQLAPIDELIGDLLDAMDSEAPSDLGTENYGLE